MQRFSRKLNGEGGIVKTVLILSILFGLSAQVASAAGKLECKLDSARETLAAGTLDTSALAPGERVRLPLVPEYPEFSLTGAVSSYFAGEKQMVHMEFLQNGRPSKDTLLELADLHPEHGARLWIRMVSGSAIHSYELSCILQRSLAPNSFLKGDL